ncbi:dual specificity protein phosphatase family protein [Nocardioides marmoribigeumensis]|uniref:Protein-tyrosine phosphatase n=1 Tax=Nocardioides marmoribigeumensis TaxID=433649 RepID=A0ABU2BYI6_9ACTN|nr:dual specificity protein phosphatase [Nocardioides marmoribigeumensis]MDR7363470.1 protein-tyrosine phosphatase [Nocardioides marmoribigeumensis]
MPDPRQPRIADAVFVTDRLLVGGDLDARDDDLAGRQLAELVELGVTHVVDVRVEWDDLDYVAERAPAITYLHHGMDDAGQQVPLEWFDEGVAWIRSALEEGGTVLAHCHMGINRGPSLGYAVMLTLGWDPVEALDAIRRARPQAYVAYAEQALRWHHIRTGGTVDQHAADQARLKEWRRSHALDLETVIRLKREQGEGGP